MNVLIFPSWYPDGENFTNGIFIQEQVKALNERGLKPIVYYPYDKSVGKNKVLKSIEDDVLIYRSNTDYMKNTKLSKLNSIILAAVQLRNICRENHIDIIHAHVCYNAGITAYVFSRFTKIPYLITEHRSNVGEFSAKIYNRILFKKAYKNAAYVITVSKFLSNELKSIGYEFNSKIIGNVVNTSEFKFRNKRIIDDKINLLSIGSMKDDIKGFDLLIPAAANIIKNKKNKLILTIIGDGIRKTYYEKLAKDLKIDNCCIFIGRVEKKYIPDYINKCDILVSSSRKETFGSVIIEALSGGKPVLATRCGGPEEIITDQTGILVEPGSIQDIEMGLIKIIDDYDKYNSETIRDYVENKYSYKIISEKLIKLYKLILK